MSRDLPPQLHCITSKHSVFLLPMSTTASQTAIASDSLNRRRNRKEFPQRETNLAIFHRKTHHIRNRIVTAEKSQPISQKESLRTLWLRKRIASFNRKSSLGDGALRFLHPMRKAKSWRRASPPLSDMENPLKLETFRRSYKDPPPQPDLPLQHRPTDPPPRI